MRRYALSHTLLLALAAGTCASTASAAEYYIADGHSEALAGAIRDANASDEADTIHLAAGGRYRFAQASEDGFILPPVRGKLTLKGQGAELQRESTSALAWLEVTAGAELDIDALTFIGAGRGSLRNHGTLRATHSAILAETSPPDADLVQNFGRMPEPDLQIGAIAGVAPKTDALLLKP